MYVKKNPVDYSDCSVRIAIDILSTSWNTWLISEINEGVVRPCDLHRSISVAPKRVLTKQLGELQKNGYPTKEGLSCVAIKSRILTDRIW